MVCFARRISAVIAVAVFLLLPLKLYADWSSFLPSLFTDDSQQKPAAAAAPADPGRLRQSPAASGEPQQITVPAAARTMPVAADTVFAPVGAAPPIQIVAAAPRDLAPFAPDLTFRSQLLTVDSEWRGTVLVDGGITVAPAATLTILPGTVVRFSKGAGIHVLGRIVVQGTADNPVRLTSLYREPQDSDWSGIILSGTEKRNILEHVIIDGADTALFARFSSFAASFVEIGASAVGVKLQSSIASVANGVIAVSVTGVAATKSELFMEKSALSGGQSGIIATASAVEARQLSIRSCRLTAFSAVASQLKLEKMTLSACQAGVRLNSCDGAVADSVFSNNLETGVVLTGSNLRFTGNTVAGNKVGMQIDDNLPSIWANAIAGNSSYNLIYLGDESLFAGGNSFGGAAAGEIEQKIFSKRPGAVQMVPVFASEPLMKDK